MLQAPENRNCYEYLKFSTGIYDDFFMMQHFGVNYERSEMFAHIDALAAYFQKDLGLKRGDVYTIFMPTTVQSILAFYALNKIGVITSFVHPLMATEFLKEQLHHRNRSLPIVHLYQRFDRTIRQLREADRCEEAAVSGKAHHDRFGCAQAHRTVSRAQILHCLTTFIKLSYRIFCTDCSEKPSFTSAETSKE